MSIFEFDEEQYKQALVEETMQLAQERIRKAEEQARKFEEKANQAEKQVKQSVEKEKKSKEKICRALLKKDMPLDFIAETTELSMGDVLRIQKENDK